MSPATTRKSAKKVSTVRLKADPALMMKQRVADYVAALPPSTNRRMRQMRALILSVAPDAVDWFSYGIPGYRLFDKPFVWYAAFKEHVSLFPMTGAIRTAFAKELEGYETSKGTVRFPHDQPLPATLIKRLVKARLKEAQAAR